MAEMQSSYTPPLALTIISSISIGIAALAAAWVMLDIIVRRGWKSMMAIMHVASLANFPLILADRLVSRIPVYVINALYLWPITLWTYLNYGRPPKAKSGQPVASHCAHHPPHAAEGGNDGREHPSAGGADVDDEPETLENQSSSVSHGKDAGISRLNGHHSRHAGSERPMFATITVAVCHCGAGCVLGDIIGEWIVYGAGVTIEGSELWPAYLIDFACALAIGIGFQYFSIAPMAGEYGVATLWRAAKADVLSLLSFEVGLFAWMAIFQIAIFEWRLEMNTATYWWMMQIGMFLGHWTGVPVNWWLIKTGVKEPCA